MCENINCENNSKSKRKYVRSEAFLLKSGVLNESPDERKARQKESKRIYMLEYNKTYNKVYYEKKHDVRLEDAKSKVKCEACQMYHSKSNVSKHIKTKLHLRNVEQSPNLLGFLSLIALESEKIINI